MVRYAPLATKSTWVVEPVEKQGLCVLLLEKCSRRRRCSNPGEINFALGHFKVVLRKARTASNAVNSSPLCTLPARPVGAGNRKEISASAKGSGLAMLSRYGCREEVYLCV